MSNFKVIPMRNFANEPVPTDKLILIQDGATTPEDLLDISSAISSSYRRNVREVDQVDEVLTFEDDAIFVNSEILDPEVSLDFDIYLPELSDADNGKTYTIKNIIGPGTVNIYPQENNLIDYYYDDTLPLVLGATGDCVTLISYNQNWWVISRGAI
jgi:hypothetical protein